MSPWTFWCLSAWMGACAADAFVDGHWGWGLFFLMFTIYNALPAVAIWMKESKDAPPNRSG